MKTILYICLLVLSLECAASEISRFDEIAKAVSSVVRGVVSNKRYSDEAIDVLNESQSGHYMTKIAVPHTYFTIDVAETLSGEVMHSFVLRVPGASAEDSGLGYGFSTSLSYDAALGEELLLFVMEDEHNPGQYMSYGHSEGAYEIRDHTKLGRLVIPKSGHSWADSEVPKTSTKGYVKLSEIESLLKSGEAK